MAEPDVLIHALSTKPSIEYREFLTSMRVQNTIRPSHDRTREQPSSNNVLVVVREELVKRQLLGKRS